MSETSETPLATQTAAPPSVPPRRPVVAVMPDDDWMARLQEQRRQLEALLEQTAAIIRVRNL
jgi:hypothetical protein